MTNYQQLKKYAKDCIQDRIPSGKKHKWACKRFLDDCRRAETLKTYPFEWDEDQAQGIVDWFSYLRHSKGELSGEPIILTPWQKFILCQLYGWRNKKTGRKRFKKSFVEVARKNAKSQMEAGIALYEISVQATRNGEAYEYYTAGVKREQSKVIFEECKLMLNGSPLRPKFKLTNAIIQHRKTGSFIKALSKDDGKRGDGTNPAGLILDEYHQHKTTEFYDLGLGSNTKESLLMIITTAGMDLTYPCYTQEYKYTSDLLNPHSDIKNDEYLTDICEIDPEDDVAIERNWKKANPIRMYYKAGVEKIRGEYKIARDVPEKMIAFLTKCLNRWVQQKEAAYMDMAKWKACEVEELPIDTKGMEVYVGFDMSSKIDLTSVAFVIPFQTGRFDQNDKEIIGYILKVHSFIPNMEKVRERVLKDLAPYDAWVQMGYISVTDTPIVDQGAVMRYVLEECEKQGWKINTLCFDPNNAAKLIMDLSKEGYIAEEVFQSYRHLNEATKGFREAVYCGEVYYLPNPVLNYAMGNAVVRQHEGLIKIDKDATEKKIDPVDASLCAFKLARYHEFTGGFMAGIYAYLGIGGEEDL